MEKKILIFEDDEILQRLLLWRLNVLGYSVCGMSATAEDAITLVQEKKPDAVLMNIGLKGHVDGISAAAAIKKTYKLPVVFLTDSAKEEDLERAKTVHPEGYIVKPFNDTDLRVALKLALNPDQEHL